LYKEAVYISLSRKQIEPVENSEQFIAKKPEFLRSPSHCHYSVQESQQGKKEFVAGGLLPPINECSPDVSSQAGSLHRRKASFGVAEETSKLSKGVQKILRLVCNLNKSSISIFADGNNKCFSTWFLKYVFKPFWIFNRCLSQSDIDKI